MEDNFELFDKNSIEQTNNQIKLRCRELTYKLLSFSSKLIKDIYTNEEKNKDKENNNINNITEEIKDNKYSIAEHEVKKLSK